MLRSTLALAAATLALADGAATSSSICQSAAFQSLTPTQLGSSPLLVRSLVSGTEVCLEFQLASSVGSASWFAVGPAASASMVNSPTSNVMHFQGSIGRPVSYTLGGYSSSEVKPESDQTFFAFHQASTSPLKFSYQRTLAKSSPNDVALDPTGSNEFIWAYGTSWPISSHRAGTKGTVKYTLNSVAGSGNVAGNGTTPVISISTPKAPYCEGKNCTAIVGGIAFLAMLIGGFFLTSVIPYTPLGRILLQRTLISPPVKQTTNAAISSPVVMFLQNLADLCLGEVLVILIFAAAMAVLVGLNHKTNRQKTSGQAALLIVMFMILPITRIPLWKLSFGSSFERIVKFHRWLGMGLTIATFIHLLEARRVTKIFKSEKYGEVYPVYGTIAFISFVLIILTANTYMRRMLFDVFYLSHRVLSIVGFVFTILHNTKTIGLALLVPLVLYALGVVYSWIIQYSTTYEATVTLHEQTGVTTLLLNSNEKTKHFAQNMGLCSYFYVRIPAVSGFQWHPFSAIVTPNGDSIGFAIRSMGPPGKMTFTRELADQARENHSLAINLCGPLGKLSVDVNKYDVIVLIGGGIGVTPLLSALNQHRLFAKKSAKAADWNILWSVRRPDDLLMIDQFMPTQGQLQYSATNVQEPYQIGAAPPLNATWNSHCSEEKNDGVVTRPNGEQIAYRAGIPVLDEYINTGRYMGRKVAVLACGPPTMVVEAQALARNCGFDFHKEVFHW